MVMHSFWVASVQNFHHAFWETDNYHQYLVLNKYKCRAWHCFPCSTRKVRTSMFKQEADRYRQKHHGLTQFAHWNDPRKHLPDEPCKIALSPVKPPAGVQVKLPHILNGISLYLCHCAQFTELNLHLLQNFSPLATSYLQKKKQKKPPVPQ